MAGAKFEYITYFLCKSIFQDQEQKTGLLENTNVTIHEKGFTPIP